MTTYPDDRPVDEILAIWEAREAARAAERRRMLTALWLAIPAGLAYPTKYSVNFAAQPEKGLPKMHLRSTLELARRQMAEYGIGYADVSDEDVAAYCAWADERYARQAASETRIRLIGPHREMVREGAATGNFEPYTRIRVYDGTGEELETRRFCCLERWDPQARNRIGGLGAVRFLPHLEAMRAYAIDVASRRPNARIELGFNWDLEHHGMISLEGVE